MKGVDILLENIETIISVVLVCKNEENTIEKCLNSLINQSRMPDEILVVDGMSTDETQNIVRTFIKTHSNIKLIINDKVFTPHGLNLGIKKSKGNIIMIAGGHSIFDQSYLKQSIDFLLNNDDAYAVGGVSLAQPLDQKSVLQKSIAYSYSSSFGTASKHRYLHDYPIEVDTVAYACYRKEVFEKIGYFDERLLRNQDIEFNYRMRKNGLKIFLLPVINIYYVPTNYKKFLKKNFSNGYWNILTLRYTPHGLSLRHFVPFFFVTYLIILILLLIISRNNALKIVFSLPLIFYLILDSYFSLNYSIRERKISLFFCSMVSFLLLHLSYGIGTLWSLVRNAFVFNK
jgi:GT2 family glycosyltransferase